MPTKVDRGLKKLEFSLTDPHMSPMHRAGLAGLYMTLQQLEREGATPVGGLVWQLSPRRVEMVWAGNDREVLDWLLKESFRLNDGLIDLRGLGFLSIQGRVLVHQGILGTLLQRNSTHKKVGVVEKAFEVEENQPPLMVRYKALSEYVYQNYASSLCDKDGYLSAKVLKVSGWLHPGAAVKHMAFGSDTSFEESAVLAFLLLFAPVGCFYFQLQSRLRAQRAQFALIVPEVLDLEGYARYRQRPGLREMGFKDFHASSLGDAGLRFLTLDETAKLASEYGVPRCRVLTLGTVNWSAQQKTRTDSYLVEPGLRLAESYYLCRQELPDRMVMAKDGSRSVVITSFSREIVAENLVRGRPWYEGFADKVNSDDLFKQLTYERGGLYKMIRNSKLEWTERERQFVQACHEGISSSYGQLANRTREGEAIPFDKFNVRFRTSLSRCKNAATFREFMADFWARSGYVPTLRQHWNDLMGLVLEDWRKARDLALLALASYQGKGVRTTVDESELEIDEMAAAEPDFSDLEEEAD
ncbi:MAG TPA: type I-MYXAN CRISPR-associated Cas8a1/Cmx1 [Cyanobacteria bacterium UBA8156]|nr:type I-MYXAN CRISPR-associated Cas8a1/Cmx1 [Cyanobacteria bacterium UBA8156]